MSAIKPALEAIHTGWEKNIQNVLLFCNDVSDRNDANNSFKVCTKIDLLLTLAGISSKVVLHFHHTDDKIQVQRCFLIQGVFSVIWIVENLIKTLTTSHM